MCLNWIIVEISRDWGIERRRLDIWIIKCREWYWLILAGLVWLQKKQKNSIVKNLTNTPSVPKNRHFKSLKSYDNVYYQHFIVKNITKFFMCSTQKNAFNRTVFCVFSQYICFNMALNFVLFQQKNTKKL